MKLESGVVVARESGFLDTVLVEYLEGALGAKEPKREDQRFLDTAHSRVLNGTKIYYYYYYLLLF